MRARMSERHVLVSTTVGPFTAHVYLARRAKTRAQEQEDLDYAANLLQDIAGITAKNHDIFWMPMMMSTELDAECITEVQEVFVGLQKVSSLADIVRPLYEAYENYKKRRKNFFIGGWIMSAASPESDKLMELH